MAISLMMVYSLSGMRQQAYVSSLIMLLTGCFRLFVGILSPVFAQRSSLRFCKNDNPPA
ncbi:MAG: hypothetical protein SPI30_07585 [Prevotella sp.]|nr:hypothetical protein [Prevotella sp.]